MDRRLQNNLTALAVSGAALVVALVAAAPLPADAARDAPAVAAGDEAASALIAALEKAGGTETHINRRIAMPYFTFLPRG